MPRAVSLYPGSSHFKIVSVLLLLTVGLCLHANEGTDHNLNLLLQSITLPPDGRSPVIFKSISRGHIDPETVRQYGEGSSFFLALHAREKGYPEAAEELLRVAVAVEDSPFRDYARLEYLDFLFERERYEDFVSEYLGMKTAGVDLEEILQPAHRAKILFGRLLDAFRRDDPEWKELLRELIVHQAAKDLPAVLFEASEDTLVTAFKRSVEGGSDLPFALRGLFAAKTAYARRNYLQAYREYAEVLQNLRETGSATGITAYISGPVTDEFALSALYTGHSRQGVDIVSSLEKRILQDDKELQIPRFWLLETEGYLLRKLGSFSEARLRYEESLEPAPREERERILWYIFDTRFRAGFTEAVQMLPTDSEAWEDHSYFNDVLFNLIDRLVYYSRWELIAELAEAMEGRVSSVAAARAAYIAARAAESGLLEAERERIDHWFEMGMYNSRGIGSGLYYRIMSAWRLKERGRKLPFELLDPASFCSVEKLVPAGGQTGSGATRAWGIGKSKGDLLIEGFVRFRLAEEAFLRYGDARGFLESLSTESIRGWSSALQERKAYLESVRLFNRYCEAKAESIELQSEDLKLLYPTAYAEFIDPLAGEYGFPPFLFYALVREESLFDADISSVAGAVGLSQLMPSTALDVASRIGLTVDDLTDPALNLRLGAWYLDHLLGRTENYSRALFAYNGGITRVRRWVRDYSYLPGDLLLERIPFAETAHYGRKVLVSSVFYGYFYDKIDYLEIITRFFF